MMFHVKRPDRGSRGSEVKPSRPPKEASRGPVFPKSAWMDIWRGLLPSVRLKKRGSHVTVHCWLVYVSYENIEVC